MTSLQAVVAYDALHHQRLCHEGNPLMMRCGTGGLPQARNMAATHFLDRSAEEWLWFVDTDMGFPPDAVDRLVDAADPDERPIVGALTFGLLQTDPDGCGGFLTQPYPVIFGWEKGEDGVAGFRRAVDYPANTLVRVAGTGAACLLIHRTALEKVRAEHGDNWFTPVRYPDGRFVSEDLSFCYRCGMMDLPVWVHTGVKTTHAKTVWVSEREWLAHQTLTAAASAVAGASDA